MPLLARRATFALWLALFLWLSFGAQAAAPPPKRPKRPSAPHTAPRAGRATQVLDGTWKFQTDPNKQGETNGWTRAIPKETKDITVPSLWGQSAAPGYAGVAWYWLEFSLPTTWAKQTVRLQFQAVADEATVWLNGSQLGSHAIATTPFEFNITKTAHFGEKNLLAVRVQGDAKAGAGLWQGVLLVAHDEAYLADCFAQPTILGHLNAAITLLNTSDKSGDATLDARLAAANSPKEEVVNTHQNLNLDPGRNITTLFVSIPRHDLKLWSPESPHLYRLQLSFRQAMDVLDTLETTFGFREIAIKDNALTVNRAPIALDAALFPDDKPLLVVTVEDQERLRATLSALKSKSVNLLYVAAPPPALLRLTDELGQLIVEGPAPPRPGQIVADQLRELILRDRSHPSIIAWDARSLDPALARSLLTLDPTRYWLVGAAPNPQLWPPNSGGIDSIPPPPGFLPQSR